MGSWEEIFKFKGRVFEKPQKELVGVVEIFRKENVKKVLDLGCGTGRHTVFLAKKDFDMYSTDESRTGLDMTRE